MLGEGWRNGSLTQRNIQALVMSQSLDVVLCDTALLSDVDLRCLTNDEQRLCFYGNLLNLMILHALTVCSAVQLIQVLLI